MVIIQPVRKVIGSSKDIEVFKEAFENEPGSAYMVFKDDYSVFDWGKMPDTLDFKGRALAVMAAFNFVLLDLAGIRHHCRGLVDSDNKHLSLADLPERYGADRMWIDLALIHRPTAIPSLALDESGERMVRYDYSFFEANRGRINNYLVPLEVIFRNGLPLGSSVFKSIERAKAIVNPVEREQVLGGIYRRFNLTSEPQPGDMLHHPVVEYSTKLEEGDRLLSEDEAYRISGLREEHFERIPGMALAVDEVITRQTEKTGVGTHWDGKIELVFRDGRLLVPDVVGTPDENRIGNLSSKEVLRQWYKRNQPEFPEACDEWKTTGEGWQERCPVKPVHIPEDLRMLVAQMYRAMCNQYVKRRIFPDVPELGEVMERLERHG